MGESNVSSVPDIRYGRTMNGRRVVVCWCNGQGSHEHMPHGGGTMIFKCPPEPYYPPKAKA